MIIQFTKLMFLCSLLQKLLCSKTYSYNRHLFGVTLNIFYKDIHSNSFIHTFELSKNPNFSILQLVFAQFYYYKPD